MNILIFIDSWEGWGWDIGGKTLASSIVDCVMQTESVLRVGILLSTKWAVGASGRQSLFSLPQADSIPGRYPSTNVIWDSGSAETSLQRGFRAFNFNKALPISKENIYLWPFMLNEVFSGLENKEYGLKEITWNEVILDKKTLNKSCPFKCDVITLQYVYSEMAAGAAWEELLEEIKDGKQE